MSRVYFDHAATSPLSLGALDAMRPHLLEVRGNASSPHVDGQHERAALEHARSDVARALAVADEEIVFTGSGTEADNLAVRGACWMAGPGRLGHVVTTAVEHAAVLRTARWLEAQGQASLTVIPCDPDGVVSAGDVVEAIRPDTAVVSVMWVNNETGAVQPVEEIGRECRRRGVLFHVDAVQALGKLPVLPAAVPCDLLALSPHKVGGPAGCGVLFVRDGVKLQPAITGGDQESGLRPGTESVATVVGAARAVADAVAAQPQARARLADLTARLEAGLLAIPGTQLNGPLGGRAPGIVNLSFEDADGDVVLQALDLAGFSASRGSACTAGSTAPSPVLSAMGIPRQRARSAVRFSLAATNTTEEIERLLAVLPAVLATVRAHARG